jgi:dephospho-CoA kinase
MRENALILGITGNIASGKSLIAKAFAEKGAALVDADQLAREIVAPGSRVLQQLIERFGAAILGKGGEMNRERLAEIVFADPAAREALNRITHPAIAELAIKRLQQLRVNPEVPLVVYEAPLLFEAGAETRVDRVLVVKVDPLQQLQRLMARDGLDEAAARQRIAAQMPQQQKLARADYVIDNSGSIEAALRQVAELWERLVTVAPR